MQSKSNHFGVLDGLRALAVLMVLLFHVFCFAPIHIFGYQIPWNAWSALGTQGVSIFFVLSGFCLFYPLAKHPERADWKEFFKRRAWRILPAYLVAVAIFAVIGTHQDEGVSKLYHILSHLLFIHTFSQHTFFSLTSPLWSLGVEVQFYLIFPLLALAMIKSAKRTVITVAVISFGIQIVNYLCLVHYGQVYKWTDMLISHSLPARLIEFTAGMLVAYQYAHKASPKPALLIIGVTGLAFGTIIHNVLGGSAFIDICFVPVWYCLLYGIITQPLTIPSRILSCKPMVYIGTISYSLYLYNLAFIPLRDSYLSSIMPNTPVWIILFPLATIISGLIGYYTIEAPFMSLRKRFEHHAKAVTMPPYVVIDVLPTSE